VCWCTVIPGRVRDYLRVVELGLHHRLRALARHAGGKKQLFSSTFYKMHQFTKTGSGQTQGKPTTKAISCRPHAQRCQARATGELDSSSCKIVHSHHIFGVLVWKSMRNCQDKLGPATVPYVLRETRMKSGGGIWYLERTGKLWARAARHM
jgi:hypothetical protein